MSDAVQADVQAGQSGGPGRPVSKRGRRLLVAVIIILLLALVGVALLLVSLVAPRSGVASREDTGGITWVKSIYGWGSTPETQFVQPHKLSIDSDGTIWVADARRPGTAFAFSPEGTLVSTIGEEAEVPLRGLGPIEVGPDDRVFIGESMADWVRVFTNEGEDLGAFSVPNPIDIAYADGVMVIGSTSGFAIVDPETGDPSGVFGTRGMGDEQFDVVNGVAIGADGSIYVTDAFNNRLSKYDPTGERLWIVSTGAPGNQVDVSGGEVMAGSRETTAPAAMQLPGGVTLDGNGRVVVVDALDFTIAVFDPEDGSFIAKYGEYGGLDGQFVYPVTIDYDPTRDWFAVADSGNSRVQIVRIPGSSSGDDLAGAARRALSGPLRACIPPLLLLLVMLAVAVVRSLKRRAEARRARLCPEFSVSSVAA